MNPVSIKWSISKFISDHLVWSLRAGGVRQMLLEEVKEGFFFASGGVGCLWAAGLFFFFQGALKALRILLRKDETAPQESCLLVTVYMSCLKKKKTLFLFGAFFFGIETFSWSLSKNQVCFNKCTAIKNWSKNEFLSNKTTFEVCFYSLTWVTGYCC